MPLYVRYSAGAGDDGPTGWPAETVDRETPPGADWAATTPTELQAVRASLSAAFAEWEADRAAASVAAMVAARRQDAGVAAATAADGTSVANRAAESVGATRDNDIAEVLKALCDLLGVTQEQLATRVTANRATTPPPFGAPSPAETVGSATTRLDGPTILNLNAYYIAVGAGDPLS